MELQCQVCKAKNVPIIPIKGKADQNYSLFISLFDKKINMSFSTDENGDSGICLPCLYALFKKWNGIEL